MVNLRLKIIERGGVPIGLNDIAIFVIPKKSVSQDIGELRTISLWKLLYKIVSKMIAP